jgi:hypothetical protein
MRIEITERPFKVGDEVYCLMYGQGIVKEEWR